jgi:dCMP deaminase
MLDKWDHRFMSIAKEVSLWSKDPSTKVSAVAVKDKRILGTGFNGFPVGIADTEERLNNRELKYSLIVHAEMNLLCNLLYHGVSPKGATLYVYGLPVCGDCIKSVIQSGINRIVIQSKVDPKWKEQWDKISAPMCEEVGVEVEFMENIV